MSTLYLIRHGQASFGQQNYDELSTLGEQQANHLGHALSKRLAGFSQVQLGTMKRHDQTATACLSAFSSDMVPGKDLWQRQSGWNEYDHQDILTQLDPAFSTPRGIESYVRSQANPKAVFESLFNDAMARWMSGKHDSDYVESWQDYQDRILSALKSVVTAGEKKDAIAVFTSGGPISVVSQALLGVPPENIMALNWTLVNCGITKLVSTPNRLFVSSLNEHVHFEGEHQSMITYK